MKSIFLALLAIPAAFGAKGDYFGYIGDYTRGDAKGIYVFRFTPATGVIGAVELAAETPNPSFVAIHPDGKHLYSVSEVNGGSVSAFSIDTKTGKLAPINTESTRGGGPCHLVVDKTGRNVLVANYGGGSIAALPLRPDGGLLPASAFIQHTGSSVDPRRQGAPHAHSINLSANNQFAIVADLGLDKLLVYRFDASKGSLTPNEPPSISLKPGSGPRHFAFHPNAKFAYAINEMASAISAFRWDGGNGKFEDLQSISTLPADFNGNNTTAEVQVHRSGKFVYGSNRGHDSIAAFAADPQKGTLKYIANYQTGGKTIRNFAIDPTGGYLFAENQNSDSITVFKIDQKSGKLTATGQTIKAVQPVCIKFVAAE